MAMDGSASFGFVLTVFDVHVEPLDDWSRTPDPALRKAIRGWPAASTAIEGSTSRGAPVVRFESTHAPVRLVAYSMEVVSGDVPSASNARWAWPAASRAIEGLASSVVGELAPIGVTTQPPPAFVA